MNTDSIELDQYYTHKLTARKCACIVRKFVKDTGISDYRFLEPSAGDGVFLKYLPSDTIALDISPSSERVVRADFLSDDILCSGRIVTIGNPPFGKRGVNAANFVNHASKISDIIGFILPVSAEKWSWQKRLDLSLSLQVSQYLGWEDFRLPDGKTQKINTVFQIWSTYKLNKCLRRYSREITSHQDFIAKQYNNTEEAEKIFADDFMFAVPCQGFQDYSRKETSESRCERNKQWITLLPLSEKADMILRNIDYEKLAYRKGTTIPGFRLNDIVTEYIKLGKSRFYL